MPTTLTASLGTTELVLTASAEGASFYNYFQQAPGEVEPTQIASDVGSPFAIAVPTLPGDYLYTAAAVIDGVQQAMSGTQTVNIPEP